MILEKAGFRISHAGSQRVIYRSAFPHIRRVNEPCSSLRSSSHSYDGQWLRCAWRTSHAARSFDGADCLHGNGRVLLPEQAAGEPPKVEELLTQYTDFVDGLRTIAFDSSEIVYEKRGAVPWLDVDLVVPLLVCPCRKSMEIPGPQRGFQFLRAALAARQRTGGRF